MEFPTVSDLFKTLGVKLDMYIYAVIDNQKLVSEVHVNLPPFVV